MNTAIIILAAGESKRLGQPKQLIKWHDETLIRHACRVALEANIGPVLLVLGAHHDQIRQEIDNSIDLDILINTSWTEGMSTSIIKGITHIEEHYEDVDGVMISVCDQPFIDAGLFRFLAAVVKDQKIGACRYAASLGPPAYFHKKYFYELKKLTGDVGAKKILRDHFDKVVSIPFEAGSFDIDTPGDLSELMDNQ